MNIDWSLIVSLLALLGTVSANSIAERARRSAVASEAANTRLSLAQKRTELLLALETKRSKLHSLKIVLSTKLTLLRRHPGLAKANEDEVARLENNISGLIRLLAGHDEQAALAENPNATNSVEVIEAALVNIKRLTI